MTENVAWLELAWSLLSAIGLVWCVWLYRDADRSRLYWESQGLNGPTDIVTGGNMRSAAVRAFVQFVFLLIGLVAMMYPSRPTSTFEHSWLMSIPAFGLIIANIALVFDAVRARRDRDRLINLEVGRKRREKAGLQ